MTVRDKNGWPVEKTEGRYIQNFLRSCFLINFKKTWNKRKSN